MPRPLRVEYEGARYHVMARGNRGCRPFSTDWDTRTFLKTLSEAQEKTGWRIHAWVLMSTHYHLLLETPKANLVFGMKWLQGAFTQRYNAYHQQWGHLFQGRYKAKVIDPGDAVYFRRVADYIHLNPVAAGFLCSKGEHLADYPHSSYPWYLEDKKRRPKMLSTSSVLLSHGIAHDSSRGRRAFQTLMELKRIEASARRQDADWQKDQQALERGWVHGSEEFHKAMSDYVNSHGDSRQVYDAEQKREVNEAAAQQALLAGLDVFDLEPADLEGLKKGDGRKLLLAGWLRRFYPVSRRWIADHLLMGHENRVTAGSVFYEDQTKAFESERLELLRIVELSG